MVHLLVDPGEKIYFSFKVFIPFYQFKNEFVLFNLSVFILFESDVLKFEILQLTVELNNDGVFDFHLVLQFAFADEGITVNFAIAAHFLLKLAVLPFEVAQLQFQKIDLGTFIFV